MTRKEKQLLLKDICGRLSHKVIVQVKDWTTLDTELKTGHIRLLQEDKIELKPYLRSMSSMTEEEWEDYQKIRMIDWVSGDINGTFINVGLIVDWLNEHYFDYRGLIPMGLAIEAPEEMYN